jgi:hypothetical protein
VKFFLSCAKKIAVFRWHENPVLAEKLSHAFSEMRKPNLDEKRRYKKKIRKKSEHIGKMTTFAFDYF